MHHPLDLLTGLALEKLHLHALGNLIDETPAMGLPPINPYHANDKWQTQIYSFYLIYKTLNEKKAGA